MVKGEISIDGLLHCPVCGRELAPSQKTPAGHWLCKCGEEVPAALALNSVEGCTHGRQCNCSRKMRR